MIYYKYTASYTDVNNQPATLLIIRSCDDSEYDAHLNESKIIAKQTIVKNNNNTEPTLMQEVVSLLTLQQYNTLVKGNDDLEINPDINIENLDQNETF